MIESPWAAEVTGGAAETAFRRSGAVRGVNGSRERREREQVHRRVSRGSVAGKKFAPIRESNPPWPVPSSLEDCGTNGSNDSTAYRSRRGPFWSLDQGSAESGRRSIRVGFVVVVGQLGGPERHKGAGPHCRRHRQKGAD